jgi:hypothetical protein
MAGETRGQEVPERLRADLNGEGWLEFQHPEAATAR